jgi:protocatechuate 3,4-dioxygenase beta subunit
VARPKAPEGRTPSAPPAKPQARESIDISGQVLDPEGKPFAGAKLYLSARTPQGFQANERGTSGKDGRFHLSIGKPELARSGGERSRLLAGAPGHGPDWAVLDGSGPLNGLTLRLVKDAPVGGRILDADGQPVAGARLTVDGVSALTGARRQGVVFVHPLPYSDYLDSAKGWAGPLPGQPAVLTTAADGRFRLDGVGRDRVVGLHLEGPGIATSDLGVAAGATADHVATASRPIRGVVRDQATGKPLAGATLFLHWYFNPRYQEPRRGKAVTDKEGRYELLGLAKAPNYNLIVKPARGQLYFQRHVEVQDTAGLDPLTADIDMVQGLTVRGKVTDQATGKPVAQAIVDYHPLYPNPNANRKVSGFWRPRSEATTGPDGSYALTVLPGPGLIGVVGPNPDAYSTACVTPRERKDFFKLPVAALNDKEGYFVPASGGNAAGVPHMEDDYNALVLLEPGEGDQALVKDIALERPLERKGHVVDPDGRPIAGVTVNGLSPRELSAKTLKGAEFTVRGLNPRAKRGLVFHHGGRNLGLYLKELPDEKLGPLTVKLQPCGSISGRIVDQDGQPVAGVHTRGGLEITTDKEGRFHVEGLVPGMEYHILRPKVVATVLVSVVVDSGKHKDLGDLKVDN